MAAPRPAALLGRTRMLHRLYGWPDDCFSPSRTEGGPFRVDTAAAAAAVATDTGRQTRSPADGSGVAAANSATLLLRRGRRPRPLRPCSYAKTLRPWSYAAAAGRGHHAGPRAGRGPLLIRTYPRRTGPGRRTLGTQRADGPELERDHLGSWGPWSWKNLRLLYGDYRLARRARARAHRRATH